MKTRSKDLGTRNETRRVLGWRTAGVPAGRLAEGGNADIGDLWVGWHPDIDPDFTVIEEAKFRTNLNPHRALAAAIDKAGHDRVLLSHYRLTRKDGNVRRTPDGLPEIVAMAPSFATVLLRSHIEVVDMLM